ncbi:PREDICTED: uncharacterized protein LOC105128139 [Populus euphratica]|uniref:Uncharacterized protein LOC105128139 n=1 Tax=Populus euphratica TaxID=75702 RepID=A0AAJ6XR58_POPEU|nr:PREDICTED: uncharacterized protein LOC105128139 [Populus euphratica]
MLHEEQKFLLLVKRPIISLVVDDPALVQHFHSAANAGCLEFIYLIMEISNSPAWQTPNEDHISIDIRVKESLRNANEKAFIPDKVSIGPYRHGKRGLEAMEQHKWRYVHALLNRRPNLEASLDDCLTALRRWNIEHACCEEESSFATDEFLQMMLVDGCFSFEMFLKYSTLSLRRRNDPVFTTPGMLFDLRSNRMLLENQIPLFILLRLYEVVQFLNNALISSPSLPSKVSSGISLHVLEHFSSDTVQNITSYVFFMKNLFSSDKDVKLLQQRNILTNYDSTEKEVARLFKKLFEEVNLNESSYDGLFDQVEEHKGTRTT